MVARRVGEKARKIAAHLLEVSEEDVEFHRPNYTVRGAPDRAVTIQDVAFAAYTNFPDGMEAGLEGTYYYDPPNLTFPFGTYAVAVEVDPETGEWQVKRMVAAAGNHVVGLHRSAFGALQLPPDLAPGQWRWVPREAIAPGL
mgnify:CR=1 FL=1